MEPGRAVVIGQKCQIAGVGLNLWLRLNMKWAGPVFISVEREKRCHKIAGEKESAAQFPQQRQENIYLG